MCLCFVNFDFWVFVVPWGFRDHLQGTLVICCVLLYRSMCSMLVMCVVYVLFNGFE